MTVQDLQIAPSSGLLERERELDVLGRLLGRAARGQGALVVLEGPAGIGKTSMLDAACGLAAGEGLAVYRAAGLELERLFAWGVARQLFERPLTAMGPDARGRVLTGVAALAEQIVSSPPRAGAASTKDPFAALHALYWLCANLAEERPALIAVDDAHWCDEPTLRFLAYLAARAGELPMVLLAATRPPDGGSSVLRTLARDPTARRLSPAPLSRAAAAGLLERALGSPPEEAFTAACHEATGGNPFLLGMLAASLAEAGVAPSGEHAERARDLGSRALSETVVHRMLRLPEPAQRLARAAAVLAPEAEPHLAARLAGLGRDELAAAGDALVAEHVLLAGAPLRFAHPLVQAAITAATPASERDALHVHAAELLRADLAPPERVAGHWLLATPAARPDAYADVRQAGRLAAARGAPETAVRYLRRALEEPPPPEQRAEALGELAAVEVRLALEVGERHLRQALTATANGRRFAELARELRMPLFATGRHAEAAELFGAAAARLEDADRELRLKLRADEAGAARLATGHGLDLWDALALAGSTPGERALLAVTAFERTIAGGTAAEVAELAARASAGGAIAEESDEYVQLALLVYAMLAADRFDDAARLNRAALERARRGSLRLSTVTFSWTAAMIAHRRGLLAAAQADAEQAVTGATAWGVDAVLAKVGSTLIEVLVDRGRLAEAREALAAHGDRPQGRGFIANWLRFARARLRLAEGDAGGACDDLEDLLEADAGWRGGNPACYPLRSTLALALLACGEPEAARQRAAEELELARRWGTPTAIGVALRALGQCERGQAALDALGASNDTLADSPAQLERAHSLIELGAAIRRAGRRTEAMSPLRAGLELADRCGAETLAERGRNELRAAGARPRRSALSGVEALTPSELRVAKLGAEGLTNREIAQALFVTLRTVEIHLTRTYQKLSITSRTELKSALAAAS